MTTAYLALGANLGHCQSSLQGARTQLNDTPGVDVLDSSALYRTEPVGGPQGQPPYLNAALEVRTTLDPHQLLKTCQQIEAHFGRVRQEVWGPRTLDIDILLYNRLVLSDPDLILPHPRLHERLFVLVPLMDLAPELDHPVLHKTIRQLLAACPDTGGIDRLQTSW